MRREATKDSDKQTNNGFIAVSITRKKCLRCWIPENPTTKSRHTDVRATGFPFCAVMTVTLLTSPPDLQDQIVRHSQKNVELLVLPPLAGADGTILGELFVCERYAVDFKIVCAFHTDGWTQSSILLL